MKNEKKLRYLGIRAIVTELQNQQPGTTPGHLLSEYILLDSFGIHHHVYGG